MWSKEQQTMYVPRCSLVSSGREDQHTFTRKKCKVANALQRATIREPHGAPVRRSKILGYRPSSPLARVTSSGSSKGTASCFYSLRHLLFQRDGTAVRLPPFRWIRWWCAALCPHEPRFVRGELAFAVWSAYILFASRSRNRRWGGLDATRRDNPGGLRDQPGFAFFGRFNHALDINHFSIREWLIIDDRRPVADAWLDRNVVIVIQNGRDTL